MKKLIAALCMMAFLFTVTVGCGGNTANTAKDNKDKKTTPSKDKE